MVSKKRILFLINPRSGGQKVKRIIAELKYYSECVDSDIEIEELDFQFNFDKIKSRAAFDVVVVGGGDGTISSLLPHLAELNSKIGILPLGTGNDLARELGLSKLFNFTQAAELVKFFQEANSREITYFNVEYGQDFLCKWSFINYVSFGFDAKVVADFAQLRKANWWSAFRSVWLNRIGYSCLSLINMWHKITALPLFTIRNESCDKAFAGAKSIVFTNICSFMGLGKSNAKSSIFDKMLECIVVESIFNYLAMLSHYRFPLFHPCFVGSSSSWELFGMPEAVAVQVDGEPAPELQSKQYRISPAGKLLVIVGEAVQ